MKTSAEFLALSERYRLAKLGTQDAATRHQLELFERSYFLLAKGVQLLTRSRGLREALKKRVEQGHLEDR